MSKALDCLVDVIFSVWMRDGCKHLGPGQVVLRLSSDKREILKDLKSDDLANIRPDFIFGDISRYGRHHI